MKTFMYELKLKFTSLFAVGEGKSTTKKMKIFTLSSTVGLLVAIGFLGMVVDSPFTQLFEGMKNIFTDDFNLQSFYTKFAILAIGGIAVAIGFKSGVFNIGVSGQMIMGGFSAGVIALKLGDSVPNGVGQILVLFISITLGALFGAVAGVLKALFKIHEVVSTILLNWIAFYYMKEMLHPSGAVGKTIMDLDGTGLDTFPIGQNYLFLLDGSPIIPMLFLTVGAAVVVWFVLAKTTLGKQFIMVGKNKDAAKFAGINENAMTTASLAFSGGIAGILGIAVYFTLNTQFKLPTIDVIPQEGFDGVAICLIAFSNPLAILPVGFFFAMIYGSVSSNIAIDPVYTSLALGLLLLVTSIGAIFTKVEVRKWFYRLFKGKDGLHDFEKYLFEKEEIHEKFIEKLSNIKWDGRSHLRNLRKELKNSDKAAHSGKKNELATKQKTKKEKLFEDYKNSIKEVKDKYNYLFVKNGKLFNREGSKSCEISDSTRYWYIWLLYSLLLYQD